MQACVLKESTDTEVVLFAYKMERVFLTFPLPARMNVKKSFSVRVYTEIAILFVYSHEAPPLCHYNNAWSEAPRRSSTVGDLWDCFRRL